MNQEEINLAFENRWRVKANLDGKGHIKGAFIPFVSSEHQEEILLHIKTLCRDFFTAGIMIGEKATVPEVSTEGSTSFETWWNLYDKKRGKEKCQAKWDKLKPAEQLACLHATPAYVASTPDKAWRKDPLTYLNGKCWNDEIIIKNGNSQPTIEQQRLSKLADILSD